jgi:integrase
VAWAWLPDGIKPITASYRLSTVRGFARYLHAIDPAHEVPPPGLLAVPRRRPAPYLYSPEDLVRMLGMTRLLRPPLRAAAYQTLFGLLAACGLRIGEALALPNDDVDLDDGVLTIRHAKFDRMRLVPLHPSVTAALREYAAVAAGPAPRCAPAGSSSRPPAARCSAGKPSGSSTRSPSGSGCAPAPPGPAFTTCGTPSRSRR